ncbi:MAG TPA: hypothetical protein VGN11_04240, partial [Candidatus Baltobacteraceae bacterium]|nr:hypothetical protein [Candidatus Baltobacteraceae bacterium]
IAAYTHPIEAGTFNRRYTCVPNVVDTVATLTCAYDAPDLGAASARFQKTFSLRPDSTTLSVTLRASVPAVSLSAITTDESVSVAWPDDPLARGEQDDSRPGYRLERLTYPAGRDETISFTLQGPLPGGANRPQSH